MTSKRICTSIAEVAVYTLGPRLQRGLVTLYLLLAVMHSIAEVDGKPCYGKVAVRGGIVTWKGAGVSSVRPRGKGVGIGHPRGLLFPSGYLPISIQTPNRAQVPVVICIMR